MLKQFVLNLIFKNLHIKTVGSPNFSFRSDSVVTNRATAGWGGDHLGQENARGDSMNILNVNKYIYI